MTLAVTALVLVMVVVVVDLLADAYSLLPAVFVSQVDLSSFLLPWRIASGPVWITSVPTELVAMGRPVLMIIVSMPNTMKGNRQPSAPGLIQSPLPSLNKVLALPVVTNLWEVQVWPVARFPVGLCPY